MSIFTLKILANHLFSFRGFKKVEKRSQDEEESSPQRKFVVLQYNTYFGKLKEGEEKLMTN